MGGGHFGHTRNATLFSGRAKYLKISQDISGRKDKTSRCSPAVVARRRWRFVPLGRWRDFHGSHPTAPAPAAELRSTVARSSGRGPNKPRRPSDRRRRAARTECARAGWLPAAACRCWHGPCYAHGVWRGSHQAPPRRPAQRIGRNDAEDQARHTYLSTLIMSRYGKRYFD
eukprot:SAG31_NODE_6409_length_2030_cov_1.370274_1_plen_171_part_00